jgi:hypothetical protein
VADAAALVRGDQRGSRAAKRIEDDIAAGGNVQDRVGDQLHRLHGRVPGDKTDYGNA